MREFKLILRAINNFRLNLKGLKVLTEAASGNYIWGPIIAAKAGADVIAFAKDSSYGSAGSIRSETGRLARKFGLSGSIKVVTGLTGSLINKADIITNSGSLRPLGWNKLKYCKTTAVIPLMWETWEFRDNDLDLRYCFEKNIPVLGTNESHPHLGTISYLGPVVKKMLLENNIEVYGSNIGIAGAGKFAKAIYRSLSLEGANCRNVSSLGKADKNFLSSCDALVFADHETDDKYIGANAKISSGEIKKINKDLLVVHISGNVDPRDMKAAGIKFYPAKIAPPHYMSAGTDYAGPKPLIDLFAAGLKVGELMSRQRLAGSTYSGALSAALRNNLCQDFSSKQKLLYFK